MPSSHEVLLSFLGEGRVSGRKAPQECAEHISGPGSRDEETNPETPVERLADTANVLCLSLLSASRLHEGNFRS